MATQRRGRCGRSRDAETTRRPANAPPCDASRNGAPTPDPREKGREARPAARGGTALAKPHATGYNTPVQQPSQIIALVLLASLSLGFEWEGRLSRLMREYDAGDAGRRREIVRLWGGYGAADVGDALLRALGDRDAGVRMEAAQAAGRVRLRVAAPRLLDWLDDSAADVRASAARALGDIGDPRTVDPLVRALGDSNAEVRRAAIRALATIGGTQVVVPLLGRLDDDDSSVRIDAAEALGRLGDARAVVPLIGRARDDVPEVRLSVFTSLGALGDERALPALLQGLRDEVERPRLAAVAALGQLRTDAAVAPLVAMLHRPDERISRAVVSALGTIATDDAIEAVLDALARNETRALAAEVMGAHAQRVFRAEGEAGIERLAGALARSLETTRGPEHATALAESIERLCRLAPQPNAAPPLLAALRAGRGNPEAVMRALAASGSTDALVPLLERLAAPDEAVAAAAIVALEVYFEKMPADGRAADPLLTAVSRVPRSHLPRVIRLLGKVGATRALGTLRTLLEHEDHDLRRAAVEALGAIADPGAAPALIALLDDRDGDTRFAAARALARAASTTGVATLVERIVTPGPFDRHAAINAMGGALRRLLADGRLPGDLAASARQLLTALANGPDETLAARAIDALGQWGARENAATLVALLERGRGAQRRAAALALASIATDDARAALARALDDDDPELVAAAAAAYGEGARPGDAAALFGVARAGRFPATAAAAFGLARMARRGGLEGDGAVSGLCELASSRDPFVRANAATGLAAVGAPPCPDGADPRDWLEPRHAAAVRAAAYRWIYAAGNRGGIESRAANEALEGCAASDLSTEVTAVCEEPSFPPLDDDAEVYAYSADGERLLVDHLVGLRLADGSVLIARTDANGHLRLGAAPRGALVLDDPTSTPLEP